MLKINNLNSVMKNKNKFFTIIVLAIIMISVVACGSRGGSTSNAPAETTETVDVECSSSNKWNKNIEDLDKNVGEFIELAKKVAAGDLSAIKKFADGNWVQKISDALGQLELAKANGELTEEQQNKIQEIVDKYEKMAE